MDFICSVWGFLLVSHADGHDHLWRPEFVTVTMLLSPFAPLQAFFHGSHDPGAAPLLWHCHAGPL